MHATQCFKNVNVCSLASYAVHERVPVGQKPLLYAITHHLDEGHRTIFHCCRSSTSSSSLR